MAMINTYGESANFLTYASGYFRTLTSEMIVWYWGVFKWFGVIMPRVWWWLANRLMILAAVGLLLKIIRDIKKRKLTLVSRVIIFSVLANLSYVAALFWFDWQFYQAFGRSLGMQARYYMPLLITQMALMLIGLLELGWNKRVKTNICQGLVIFFLGIQLTSLYVQITSYYDIWPLTTLVQQASQYKPFFAKGAWWLLWIILYFIGIRTFVIMSTSKNKKAKK